MNSQVLYKLHFDNIPSQRKKENPFKNYQKEIFGFFFKEESIIMHFEMMKILKKKQNNAICEIFEVFLFSVMKKVIYVLLIHTKINPHEV